MSEPQIRVSIEIDAPIDTVWAVMLDLPRYGEWNPFIVGVGNAPARVAVGARLLLDVRWASGKGVRSWETVTRLEPPAADGASADGRRTALLGYRYSAWPTRCGLVQAGREQILTQARPDRPTLYRTEEKFWGLLAPLMPVADVEDGFRRHAQALKVRAESLARE